MSYAIIRNCCVSLLVFILLLLGSLTFIVAERVSQYDRQTSQNLSQLVYIRKLETQLHQTMVEIQQAILESRSENESILSDLNSVVENANEMKAKIQPTPNAALLYNLIEFQNKLRLLKVALVNYSREVRYDPSADTTSGLEQIIMEVHEQSDSLFRQLVKEVEREIHAAHELLGTYVERVRVLSFYGLFLGVGLGITVAVVLSRALSSPLNKLIRGTEELAKGNLEYQISIKSKDEMGRLARSFNKMSRALQEKEELKSQLLLTQFSVDHATDAVFWIDRQGQFVYANHSACRRLEYNRKELYQREIFDIDPGIDRGRWSVLWRKIQNEQQMNSESHHRTRSGATFPVEITIDYLHHDSRQIVCMIARDCSERKKAELAQAELERQLQQAEKMEAIGALAGGVAHDLNNILSGIVSYPELLLIDLPEKHPMRDPLVTIQKSGFKAAAIVQDLLTLSRRNVATRESIDLNQIVEEYLNSPEYHKLMEYHPHVTVETRLAAEPIFILGSPVHISKTVMNLVSNAAEAIPDKGTIRVFTESRKIDLRSPKDGQVPEGKYSVLSVSDTGIGMTSEEQEKIFEPFYTKKVMGRSGTGLGMAVVWGTAKDHDGIIDLKSEVGSGTDITLLFPAEQSQPTPKEEPHQIEDFMGNGEFILVVDDVAEQRKIAKAMLTQLGYEATAVSSGEKAIAWLKEHPADLILLDMIMAPGIDGLATYLAIQELNPGQKAIIASGYSETEKVRLAQKAGAGHYIKKPYNLMRLGQTVQNALTPPA